MVEGLLCPEGVPDRHKGTDHGIDHGGLVVFVVEGIMDNSDVDAMFQKVGKQSLKRGKSKMKKSLNLSRKRFEWFTEANPRLCRGG